MPINPPTIIELKEDATMLKEVKEIGTMLRNALNHSPLFMPSSTERMFGFVSLLQQEIMGNSHEGLPLIQA